MKARIQRKQAGQKHAISPQPVKPVFSALAWRRELDERMRREARERKEADKLNLEIALLRKQLTDKQTATFTRNLDELKNMRAIPARHAAELFSITTRRVRDLVKGGRLNRSQAGKIVTDDEFFAELARRIEAKV